MSTVGNNPEGSYLMERDEPDPCDMEQVRNDVQHASRWNRAHRAIEILCGRIGDPGESELTIIERITGTSYGEHMAEQRPAGERMKDLRPRRAHALALARRENDDFQCHPFESVPILAFSPRLGAWRRSISRSASGWWLRCSPAD